MPTVRARPELLLVPCDPLTPRRPDPHFAAEVDQAAVLDIAVHLVDHDALTQGGSPERAVAGTPSGVAVYRGWMLTGAQYTTFANALAQRGTILRTSPADFRRAHELPGWYDTFRDLTPASIWFDTDRAPMAAELAQIGNRAAVVKDYVKSMKHYWTEAAYVPDVTDRAALRQVIDRFVELRGDDLVGGIVLREFEQFDRGELRTWWIDSQCVLITAHPDTPDIDPADAPPLAELARAVSRFDHPFITVDLARTPTGRWRVIEVGDGQVSDLTDSTQRAELIAALFLHTR